MNENRERAAKLRSIVARSTASLLVLAGAAWMLFSPQSPYQMQNRQLASTSATMALADALPLDSVYTLVNDGHWNFAGSDWQVSSQEFSDRETAVDSFYESGSYLQRAQNAKNSNNSKKEAQDRDSASVVDKLPQLFDEMNAVVSDRSGFRCREIHRDDVRMILFTTVQDDFVGFRMLLDQGQNFYVVSILDQSNASTSIANENRDADDAFPELSSKVQLDGWRSDFRGTVSAKFLTCKDDPEAVINDWRQSGWTITPLPELENSFVATQGEQQFSIVLSAESRSIVIVRLSPVATETRDINANR